MLFFVPSAVILVAAGLGGVARYYRRRHEADSGFGPGLAVVELPGTNRWNAFERQLAAIPEGARVWVLYAHHPTWRSQPDEAFVRYELARRRPLASETVAPGAALHRFAPP